LTRAAAIAFVAALLLVCAHTISASAQHPGNVVPTRLWENSAFDVGAAVERTTGAARAPSEPADGGPSPLVLVFPPLIVAAGFVLAVARQRRRGQPLRDMLPRPSGDARHHLGPPPMAPEPAPHPKSIAAPEPSAAPPPDLAAASPPAPASGATPAPAGSARRPLPSRRFVRTRADALGYVSVPTVDETHREGLRHQVRRIRRACEAFELSLVALVPDDESTAATPQERPGYQRLMRRLDAGDATCLVTTSVERLASTAEEWLLLLDLLDDLEVRLIVVEDAVDTGAQRGREEAWRLAGVAAPSAPGRP
jgi:resolvase-like protein